MTDTKEKTMMLNWYQLKAISRSRLGRLAFLVPFLPFLIDFWEAMSNGVEFIHKYISTNNLKKWVESNQNAVMTMYLGLGFFLISRIVYEITCPYFFKKYESIDEHRLWLLKNMKLALDANNKEQHNLFSYRLERLEDFSHQYHRESQIILRMCISIGFFLSIAMLVTPPLLKFISIFLNYIWIF